MLSEFDPRKQSPEISRKRFQCFVEQRMSHELQMLLMNGAHSDEHISIEVSCGELFDFDPALAHSTLLFPTLMLQLFDEGIFEAQRSILESLTKESNSQTTGSPAIKLNCHARIVELPPFPYYCKAICSDIRSSDAYRLMQFSGTIVRTGAVKILELTKRYECQNPKCRYNFVVRADPEQDNLIPQPRICPSGKLQSRQQLADARQEGKSSAEKPKKCTCTDLREVEGSKYCVDYQEIKLQDQLERLPVGAVPKATTIVLRADLADKCNAGDEVVIVGFVVRQWKPVMRGIRCNLEPIIHANSIRTVNYQPSLGLRDEDIVEKFSLFWGRDQASVVDSISKRDAIIKAVCPQLCGLFLVKLAVLLTLIGGSILPSTEETTNQDQSSVHLHRRTQSHLLLVGDPGCGKSQLLRFAACLSSRSVLTTGIGTTSAGLTCSVTREGSDWALEAGALVLANEGVCCIDEFSSIKPADRAAIHEAMEQQTISVAKAGLISKLPAKTTIIASCNPKGQYDVSSDISTNTAIASPLLSRFDLILVLLDKPEKEWDQRVSTHLLEASLKPYGQSSKATPDQRSADANRIETSPAAHRLDESILSGNWTVEILRKYIAHVKHAFQPTIHPETKFVLTRYYNLQRQSDEKSNVRTTVRLLESLVRLSAAHAKLMSRQVVLLEDGIVAIYMMSLSECAYSEMTKTLQSSFPIDSRQGYQAMEDKVMAILCCSRDLVRRETSAPLNVPTPRANMRATDCSGLELTDFESNTRHHSSPLTQRSIEERHPQRLIESNSAQIKRRSAAHLDHSSQSTPVKPIWTELKPTDLVQPDKQGNATRIDMLRPQPVANSSSTQSDLPPRSGMKRSVFSSSASEFLVAHEEPEDAFTAWGVKGAVAGSGGINEPSKAIDRTDSAKKLRYDPGHAMVLAAASAMIDDADEDW